MDDILIRQHLLFRSGHCTYLYD